MFRSPHLIAVAIVEIQIYRLESSSKESQVISVIVPFDLQAPNHAVEILLKSSTALSTVFTKSSPDCVKGLHWALNRGRPIDIDIQAALSDSLLEEFEDMIASASAGIETLPPIILCMILYSFHFTRVVHKALHSQHFASASRS